MNFLIASDSFKGCMSSNEANERMKRGIEKALPHSRCKTFVISDGGEGMADAFVDACKGEMRMIKAWDLYGKPIFASYGYDPKTDTACIEAASTLGVTLYPHGRRKPLEASSFGFGMMVKDVMKRGVRQIVIGLGGTGTNDGGMGFLQAFGCVFYDASRRPLPCCAQSLAKIAFIDKRGFRFDRSVKLIAACDVENPLLGMKGATYVFGRQKGMRAHQIEETERGMEHFAAKIQQTFHVDMTVCSGGGAAGGLGALLQSVFKAQFESGIQVLADIGRLEEKIAWADFLFTGEGQSDLQTSYGKAVSQLAHMARKYQIPVVCLSGALGVGYEKLYDQGVCALFSTADRAMSFSQALHHGPAKLEQAACNLARLIGASWYESRQREQEQSEQEKEKPVRNVQFQ